LTPSPVSSDIRFSVKKCTYCGKEYPDDASVCAVDQQPLQQIQPPLVNRPAPFTSPPPASSAEAQRIIDNEHLKMLSIFHYILAGFALLGLLFICVHFMFMSTIFLHPDIFNAGKNSPKQLPEFFFVMMLFFYLGFGGVMVVTGILNLLSAKFLRQRTHRTLSLVTAGVNCLHIPFGTVVGVFTIMVLSRPSVREQYPP
jgi:hypothetical protein